MVAMIFGPVGRLMVSPSLMTIGNEENAMSESSATIGTPAEPRGAVNIILWVVQILLGVFFAFAGLNILFGFQPEAVESFAQIGLGDWFRYLTGVLELAGGIGLLIPPLSGLAALGLAGVMVGAVVAHLTALPPAALALFPAFLVIVFVLIARARWPRTKALIGKLKQ
jgi:putative oxidoreductase